MHVSGKPVHTVGPMMLKPFKSIVTELALTSIAVVFALGTVRLPDYRQLPVWVIVTGIPARPLASHLLPRPDSGR
jgi:hypothetical protein